MLNCIERGLGSIRQMQLVEDIADVRRDRSDGDRQCQSNFAIGLALSQKGQNLQFARCQWLLGKGKLWRALDLLDDLARNCGMQNTFTRMDHADGIK